MLTIKFSRKGKKNQPFFRIIVLEKSKDPWGDFLEDLGFYNPLTKKVSLKVERIKHWLSHGAQPTGSVHNLLINQGVIKADKVKVSSMSSKRLAKKQEEEKKEKESVKKQEPKQDLKQEEKSAMKEKESVKENEKKETKKDDSSKRKENHTHDED
ncbi:30S ribosomal protein S16 [Patescibacteria group bacterium]|nr:30S ribosomal protein S16 [Patescibacteria group bacterium]